MATLPKSAPYYKRFFNGDEGHSHAAQEFGVVAVVTVLLGFISPMASALVVLLLIVSYKVSMPMVGDKYWIEREVRQSLAQGRNPKGADLIRVPKYPNSFWTLDAIKDVTFPRKMRPLLAIAVGSYSLWLSFMVGG